MPSARPGTSATVRRAPPSIDPRTRLSTDWLPERNWPTGGRPAQAPPLARLQQRHDESPTALGLSSDGGVLEVLVSPEGGWTILITYPKRPTCVVAVGEALQLAGQQA